MNKKQRTERKLMARLDAAHAELVDARKVAILAQHESYDEIGDAIECVEAAFVWLHRKTNKPATGGKMTNKAYSNLSGWDAPQGHGAIPTPACGSLPRLVRHSLSRSSGWRMPPNTITVARPGPWGNPFLVGPGRTQSEALLAFRVWLTVDGVSAGLQNRKQWIMDHLHELRGKNLACWCKPGTACHADVLMELANVKIRHDADSAAPQLNEHSNEL